jgi:hypothetical protein
METPKPATLAASKPVAVPQFAGGPIPLSALMQQQIPAYYANGFEVSLSGADVFIGLTHNGRQICTLNLSFISAKGMGSALNTLIKDFEEKSQTKVPTFDEVIKALDIK